MKEDFYSCFQVFNRFSKRPRAYINLIEWSCSCWSWWCNSLWAYPQTRTSKSINSIESSRYSDTSTNISSKWKWYALRSYCSTTTTRTSTYWSCSIPWILSQTPNVIVSVHSKQSLRHICSFYDNCSSFFHESYAWTVTFIWLVTSM